MSEKRDETRRHIRAGLTSLASVPLAFLIGIAFLSAIAPELIDFRFEPFCGCFCIGIIVCDILIFVLPTSILAERVLDKRTQWQWWHHALLLWLFYFATSAMIQVAFELVVERGVYSPIAIFLYVSLIRSIYATTYWTAFRAGKRWHKTADKLVE